jgi:hypothetical protein
MSGRGFIEAMIEKDEELRVAGWVLVDNESPDAVEFVAPNGEVIVPERVTRDDVAADHPLALAAGTSGFRASLPARAFQHDGDWSFELRALGEDGQPAYTCYVKRSPTKGPFALGPGFVYA